MFVVERKKRDFIDEIKQECGCNVGCLKCASKRVFAEKLARANIPIIYWKKRLTDFDGPINIKDDTEKYIGVLQDNFKAGRGICYTGTFGTGKTYASCSVLKFALMNNYSAYYTTLSDLVHYMTDHTNQSKFFELLFGSDFLCIDEVDSRHFAGTEQAESFFGRNFERIIRYRTQNMLPLILATNNATLDDAFAGQFRKVVESLLKVNTVVVPALGPDYRLRNE